MSRVSPFDECTSDNRPAPGLERLHDRAWYGNLKFPDARLLPVIVISWGIALAEYCFAVPANRLGYARGMSAGQLKITQEVITLIVFFAFATLVLKEPLGWRHAGAFACLVGAVAFMFAGKG